RKSNVICLWIWSFILAVAVADVYFSWRCQNTVSEWELNPVAECVLEVTGIVGVTVYRAGVLVFAAVMSFVKCRFSWLVTSVWMIGHLYLLAVLAQVYPYAAALQP